MAEDNGDDAFQNRFREELAKKIFQESERQQTIEREQLQRRLKLLSQRSGRYTTIAGIVGISALILGVSTIYFLGSLSGPRIKDLSIVTKDSVLQVSAQVRGLQKNIATLNQTMSLLQRDTARRQAADYANMSRSIQVISNRVSVIESVILNNPEKALAIPLMRKDLDNYTSSQTTRINDLTQNLSNSITQVYTVIGSVTVVIGLGFVGFAAASLAGKPDKK